MTYSDSLSVIHNNSCYLLYNADLLSQPCPCLLKDEIFQQVSSYQKITAGGRGQAWFLELSGLSAVLRSYQRGGFVAKFNQQSYLGILPEKSRAFKECQLLQWMFDRGLPVPQPVAASLARWPFAASPFYRAHILLMRLENTQTLDQILCQQVLDRAHWQSVGQCIRRFHDEGVFHADLNANNILLDDQYRVYLIDFDRSERRAGSSRQARWKQDNLRRLKRSLLKQRELARQYAFAEKDWFLLVSGYDGE